MQVMMAVPGLFSVSNPVEASAETISGLLLVNVTAVLSASSG